ncbi:MAG: TolC family protein [Pirellulales bacterium]|nr:TolC family protein [Pirellulales bacterium]
MVLRVVIIWLLAATWWPVVARAQGVPPVFLPEQRRILARQPEQFPVAPLPRIPAPPTVREPLESRPEWPLSLDEAIRVALANAQVVRVLAGTTAVSSGNTVYDPAIANTTIDQQRAPFDPRAFSRNGWSKLDHPQGVIVDPGPPPQAGIIGTTTDNFSSSSGISKRLLSGATAGAAANVNQLRSSVTGLPLNPSTSNNTELSLTQPLLQGFGTRVNTAPILIARIDTERSFFQLKRSMQELVRSVVEGYWQLVFAETDVWARRQQVAQGREALERALARMETGIGNVGDVAQSRVAYENFRATLVASEANLLQREAALRNLLGIVPSDGRLIKPRTAPRTSRVETPWEQIVAAAEVYRPDLVELKLVIEADQQRLLVARNQALPNVAASGLYRFNGLEGHTPDRRRIDDNGDFADWELGVNFSVPLALRGERAQIRSNELLLMRDRANLSQAVHQSSHLLAANLRNLDQFYQQYLAYVRVREAARENLERQLADYLTGRRTLYLNVLQAITDWGNAVSSEIQSLAAYNTELATLELQTGTILESHGVRFVEERYRSLGPLGRLAAPWLYPEAIGPTPNVDQPPVPQPEQWRQPDVIPLPEAEPLEEVPAPAARPELPPPAAAAPR